jgi:hypothetical protein
VLDTYAPSPVMSATRLTGRIRFDLWRLWDFAECEAHRYGFPSEDDLKHAFTQSVTTGESQVSPYILHYLAK